MATKWGIVGAGNASSDFVKALSTLPAEEHRVVAVASRSLQNAKNFANQFNIPLAYGSYRDLSKDPNIDVVYIGVLHPYHHPTATMMIEAGKSVLCEKPLCMNVKETSELIHLARKKKVFLMEGVWSRCFPVYKELQKRLQDGEIGNLRQIITSFGRPVQNLPKLAEKELGGGLTLNIGTYTVQLVSLLMGGTKPLSITTGGILNKNGVDIAASSTLVYPEGRVATICTSAMCSLPGDALIVGSKNSIKVNFPMWCPESMETPTGRFSVPLPDHALTFNVPNAQGFIYEAEEVRDCLSKGLLESPLMPLDESLVIAEIMETIRKQVGVWYIQDQEPTLVEGEMKAQQLPL